MADLDRIESYRSDLAGTLVPGQTVTWRVPASVFAGDLRNSVLVGTFKPATCTGMTDFTSDPDNPAVDANSRARGSLTYGIPSLFRDVEVLSGSGKSLEKIRDFNLLYSTTSSFAVGDHEWPEEYANALRANSEMWSVSAAGALTAGTARFAIPIPLSGIMGTDQYPIAMTGGLQLRVTLDSSLHTHTPVTRFPMAPCADVTNVAAGGTIVQQVQLINDPQYTRSNEYGVASVTERRTAVIWKPGDSVVVSGNQAGIVGSTTFTWKTGTIGAVNVGNNGYLRLDFAAPGITFGGTDEAEVTNVSVQRVSTPFAASANAAGGNGITTLTTTADISVEDSGFYVGMQADILSADNNGTPADVVRQRTSVRITSVADAAGKVTIQFTPKINIADGRAVAAGAVLCENYKFKGTSFGNYELTDCRLVVPTMARPPKGSEKGATITFSSWENQSNDHAATIHNAIMVNAAGMHAAMTALTIPRDLALPGELGWLRGYRDTFSKFVWQVANEQSPIGGIDLPQDTFRIPAYLNVLISAMQASGIPVRELGKYAETFCLPHRFSVPGTAADLSSSTVQMVYDKADAGVPLNFVTFVRVMKQMTVGPDGISVV